MKYSHDYDAHFAKIHRAHDLLVDAFQLLKELEGDVVKDGLFDLQFDILQIRDAIDGANESVFTRYSLQNLRDRLQAKKDREWREAHLDAGKEA